MKTKNNIQKTVKSQLRNLVLRGSAVIASLVLISWSVRAQDFWKQFFAENSFENIALIMNGQSNEFEKADALADAIHAEINSTKTIPVESFTMEAETEKELEVESWMTNEALFSNNFRVTDESDKDLKLESWMINTITTGIAANSIQTETDHQLTVENWMTDATNFSSSTMKADKDAELNLESWMVEDSIFTSRLTQQDEPLKLEAWMADNKIWGF
jgi:hypothetical protein